MSAVREKTMNREEYRKELRKLYDIAIKVKNVGMALEILEKIRGVG